MVSYSPKFAGSGSRTPARLFLAAALLVAALCPAASPAHAQPGAAAPAPAAPDSLTVLKLVWSSVAALHHANETGNYSVLRDLAAPSFQANNSAATLAGIFEAIRTQRVDLSNALVVTPVYEFAPAFVEGGLLRARGTFPLRPNPIGFDLLFQNVSGQWRIFGIAVVPLAPPGAQPQQQPQRQAPQQTRPGTRR